jgi:hypothetical protein
VAQPGSASVLGTEGREFESRRPDHFPENLCLRAGLQPPVLQPNRINLWLQRGFCCASPHGPSHPRFCPILARFARQAPERRDCGDSAALLRKKNCDKCAQGGIRLRDRRPRETPEKLIGFVIDPQSIHSFDSEVLDAKAESRKKPSNCTLTDAPTYVNLCRPVRKSQHIVARDGAG